MKIGVDARFLSLPMMGIGRYTLDMSRALLEDANKYGDEYRLYTPYPPSGEASTLPKGNVRTWKIPGRLGRMLWSQTALPLAAALDNLDIFWGTTHRLPRHLPSRIARVVTIHDLVWKHAGETMRPLSRWIEQHLMPDAINLADLIIVDSDSTASDLSASFPRASKKIRVIHLGVTKLVAPEPKHVLLQMGINKPYFLSVGTIEPRKNLRNLLSAYASLPTSVRDVYSLVVAGGKGWGSVDLLGLINSLGLNNDVILVGRVSDARLSTLYANSRLLAMPSLYEGFGLPLLEAMSFGIPVLTSNCSSMPEVAGDAGLLVNPLDNSSLAKGLSDLLMDETLHSYLSANTISNVKRFSWNKAALKTREVFVEALMQRDYRCSACSYQNS